MFYVADLHTKTFLMFLLPQPDTILSFLAQLSRCAYTITFRKPYITSLEIWMIGLWADGLLDRCKLWTVGPFDYHNVKYQATSLTAVPQALRLSCYLCFYHKTPESEVGSPSHQRDRATAMGNILKTCVNRCSISKYH